MIAVMIIPTGIDAIIGGHSGDATAVASLLASACDTLILHPNVVNASDLSEQPANSLYVEGSMLDEFLEGKINLHKVLSNKILVLCNEVTEKTVNSVNAYRSLLGIDATVVTLRHPLTMRGWVEDNRATGEILGIVELLDDISELLSIHKFNAIAVHTPIEVEQSVADEYVKRGKGINPWGGVEAILSRTLTEALMVPVAHAPLEITDSEYGISDSRLAPEMICGSHLGSVLKGLHKAPRRTGTGLGISVSDLSVMVSPLCWGRPHKACRKHDIPIVWVMENSTSRVCDFASRPQSDCDYEISNYVEAAGLLLALQNGMSLCSIRRPLHSVEVITLATKDIG